MVPKIDIVPAPNLKSTLLVKGNVSVCIRKYLKSRKHQRVVLNKSNLDDLIYYEFMIKEDALQIAQAYIDNSFNMHASITGRVQYMNEWVMDANLHTVDHPVWIVFAKNLKTGPFIDGVNEYSIVVSTKTRKVEDVRLT